MLPLDSSEWSQLRHAYGLASDTPELLRRLVVNPRPQADPNAQPWERLWSSLCHQDSIYPASYAAVPHIVDIARNTQGPIDFSFLVLPTCIEISRRKGRGPAVPDDLAEAYHRAIAGLCDVVFLHAEDEWDDTMARAAAAALVMAKGQVELADALVNLGPETIARIVNDDL
jgi:hypothetical protein